METNVEYFNEYGSPTEDNPSFVPWSEGGWNRAGGFKVGNPDGRQRITRYTDTRPYLRGGQNSADDHLDWYHKRNFTLFLVNANANTVNLPGSNFNAGTITGTNPATTVVTGSAWIICAVSLRGQKRFQFKKGTGINGYCWDGQSTYAELQGHFQRARYFGCKIDFVGAAFVVGSRKRAEPIGYFHDEAVYGIERVPDAETIVVDIPVADAMLPDSRTSFPLS